MLVEYQFIFLNSFMQDFCFIFFAGNCKNPKKMIDRRVAFIGQIKMDCNDQCLFELEMSKVDIFASKNDIIDTIFKVIEYLSKN